MAAWRGRHPSDRLLHGPCSGFAEALGLVEAQVAYERDQAVRHAAEGEPADVDDAERALAQVCLATRHAGQVYREEQEVARLRTIERLREDVHAAEAALDDEAARWLLLLADGLESGDYAGLAI